MFSTLDEKYHDEQKKKVGGAYSLGQLLKMVEEIDEADRQGLLSNPISYKQSKDSIAYIEAVMKESMRIHPGIGLLLERHVPEGSAEICGQYIPGGTVVGVNAWVTHHDPKVFPNPDQFIPERWTDSCDERKAEMERSFFAFGAGPRTCIGRNISFIEIQKVVTQLLRQYEVTLAEPEKEWDVSNIWMVSFHFLAFKTASLAHPRSRFSKRPHVQPNRGSGPH